MLLLFTVASLFFSIQIEKTRELCSVLMSRTEMTAAVMMTALNGRFALPSTRNNNGQIWVFSGLSRLGTIPCIPCYLHTLPPYFK